jgi:Uma2 family endonuclease
MATIPVPTFSLECDQYVDLRNIGWAGYRSILRARGEKARPKMIYLDGNLLLIATGLPHERLVFRLQYLAVEVALGLDIPFIGSGQTTLFRRKKDSGIEADRSYYFSNWSRIQRNQDIDLRVDPPPDLAIQAVRDHGAAMAIAAFRRLRVPEVWISEDESVRILVLRDGRKYTKTDTSLTLPSLTTAEIREWSQRLGIPSDTDWMHELRRWVREVLVPRVKGPGT